jgi:hypothetical protein
MEIHLPLKAARTPSFRSIVVVGRQTICLSFFAA